MKGKAQRGRTAKHAHHSHHSKHQQQRAKHHPKKHPKGAAHQGKTAHVVAKHPAHAKARGWSLGDVSCCAAEAVAASLVAAGGSVRPADVLALYRHTADSADAGASIWATLEAAYRWGLAGVRPVSFRPVGADDPAAAILGLALPESHAVAASGGWWFSWGDRWPPEAFPAAVIEEAWEVAWCLLLSPRTALVRTSRRSATSPSLPVQTAASTGLSSPSAA